MSPLSLFSTFSRVLVVSLFCFSERICRAKTRATTPSISHTTTASTGTEKKRVSVNTDDNDGDEELIQDIEFENEWETASDWNEDDNDAADEENDLCFSRLKNDPPSNLWGHR